MVLDYYLTNYTGTNYVILLLSKLTTVTTVNDIHKNSLCLRSNNDIIFWREY